MKKSNSVTNSRELDKRAKSKPGTKLNSRGMKKPTAVILLLALTVLLVLGGVFAFVPLDDGQLGVYNYNAFASNIKLGLDVKGGVSAVFGVDYDDFVENKYNAESDDSAEIDYAFDRAVNSTRVRLTDMLASKGYTEAQVSISGSGRDQKIRVEVPDVDDPDELFELISRPATLTMYEVTGESGNYTKVDPNKIWISGGDIEDAYATQNEGQWVIALRFTGEGTKKFKDATTALQGKQLGIFLNGECIMAPKVNQAITNGRAVIEGGYEDYETANAYATQIQSGALQVKLDVESTQSVSATLGQNAINHGLIAGGVGLLIIMLIMIARYRMLGVAASISLIFFTIAYLFFMSIFPWVQLTLPGIAGILLSIGMAVDANVIIFERMREISASGSDKSIRGNIKDSFRESLSAIIDGNVTTIIGAVVLAIVAVATIKGFAMTLLIGIVLSLFSSLVMTRLIIACFTAFNDSSYALYGLNVKEMDYHIDYNRQSVMQKAVDDKADSADNSTEEVQD